MTSEGTAVPVWVGAPPNLFLFLSQLYRPHVWGLLALTLAQTAVAFSQVAIPYAFSNVVREIVLATSKPLAWPALATSTLFFLFAALVDICSTQFASTRQAIVGPQIKAYGLLCLFNHLQRHSYRFISSSHAGSLAARMSEASTAASELIWVIATDMWPAVVVCAASSAMLFVVQPMLGVSVLAFAAAYTFLAAWFGKRRGPVSQRRSAARARISGALGDVITNLLNVKLFAREKVEAERFARVLKREQDENIHHGFQVERSRLVLYFFSTSFRVVSLVICLALVASRQLIAADLVLSLFLTNLVIAYAQSSSKRIMEVSDYVERIQGGIRSILQAHEIVESERAVEVLSGKGCIEYRNVSFAYESGREVIKGLSLTIPPGQKVGLVGVSGAGKSSIVSLLLRLYDVTSGGIHVDGVDVRDMSFSALYGRIALIPQDPILFHRSVFENIECGKQGASTEEVEAAAKKGIAHDFIQHLPDQYQTLVGERGVRLSGGQRQRIAISRAILKDAPIVVFDEATSALDSITESEIQEALTMAMQDKTVIVVAHRLATIRNLDRILVFDDGLIVEDGSHEELIARGGKYQDLWSRQIGGLLPEA